MIDTWRDQLSIACKNGINFIFSASLVWAIVAVIWSMNFSDFQKGIFTFWVSAIMLPLAWILGKLLKTEWNVAGNPLNRLGLIFNICQLFYFPILFILLGKMPEYFVAGYAIITGAHFFPYAWYYRTNWFGIFAGVIAVGVWMLSAFFSEMTVLVPIFTSANLLVLGFFLMRDYKKKMVNEN